MKVTILIMYIQVYFWTGDSCIHTYYVGATNIILYMFCCDYTVFCCNSVLSSINSKCFILSIVNMLLFDASLQHNLVLKIFYYLMVIFNSFLFILTAIKKRVLVLEGQATSNTTCLARQRYKDIRGEDAPIPAYIEAQCKAGESRRKREVADTGTLVLTFTFSEEIPFDCDDSCLDTISWTLRFKYYEAQWRIATGLALTFTDLETSEKLDITVTEELELEDENPQIKCTLGRILSQDQEVCSKFGYLL